MYGHLYITDWLALWVNGPTKIFVHSINVEHCHLGAEMIYQTIDLKKRMHNKLSLNNLSREQRVLSLSRNKGNGALQKRSENSQPSVRWRFHQRSVTKYRQHQCVLLLMYLERHRVKLGIQTALNSKKIQGQICNQAHSSFFYDCEWLVSKWDSATTRTWWQTSPWAARVVLSVW